MLEELRKQSIKKVLPLVIILCIAGGVIMGIFADEFLGAIGKVKKFESLDLDEIKDGVLVEVHLTENFGSCIEETETRNGRTKRTYTYHIIWTGDEDAEDYRYITAKLPASYDNRMLRMMNEYDKWYTAAEEAYYNGETDIPEWDPEPFVFNAVIKKMTKEEERYFRSGMMEAGWTSSDYEDMAMPYVLKKVSLGGERAKTFLFFGAGLALFLWGVIYFITTLRGGRLKKLKQEIEATGFGIARVEGEYAVRRQISASPKLFESDNFIFFSDGSVPHALLKKQMIWVYFSTTVHRTNGIKTGTTYALQINMKDGRTFALSSGSEKKVKETIEALSKNIPWCVFGYSDELAGLYRKNRTEFLNILYNKVPKEDSYVQPEATEEFF